MDSMNRKELSQKVLRISGHFALSDEQKKILRECASVLQSDDEEITFLKQMQSKMTQNFSEEELGQMVFNTLHAR
jgi:hypothetical protein